MCLSVALENVLFVPLPLMSHLHIASVMANAISRVDGMKAFIIVEDRFVKYLKRITDITVEIIPVISSDVDFLKLTSLIDLGER